MVKRIIPGAYTEYEDGHLGVVPASLANVEAKLGAAAAGVPGKVYTLAGPSAKQDARTIFRSGPLLRALEAAFRAGSTRIHAVRIGSPVQAGLDLRGMDGQAVVRILGDYGSSGNNHYLNVAHELGELSTGFALLVAGSPSKVVFLDSDLAAVREVTLDQSISFVVGVACQLFPRATNGDQGFWILGIGGAGPSLWHYNQARELVPGDTVDLTGVIPDGDTILGISRAPIGPGDFLQVATDRRLLDLAFPAPGSVSVLQSLTYAELFETPLTQVAGVGFWYDLAKNVRGESEGSLLLVLDASTSWVHSVRIPLDGEPQDLGFLDLSDWIGSDQVQGLGLEYESSNLVLSLHPTAGSQDRVVRLGIDWINMEVTLLDSAAVDPGARGLGAYIEEVECTTTLTIQDRNQTPSLERKYQATGSFETVTTLLLDKVNQGGVYLAQALVEAPGMLSPSSALGGGPDPTWFDAFTGGVDSAEPTNADYLAGLEATESKTDTSWIHAVGATSPALWTAILLHCREMFEQHQSERFAILETPTFITSNQEGTAAYLGDLQGYVDTIVTRAKAVGDRNAVILAGGARLLDGEGVEYIDSVVAPCGGTMASLEVQRSLINKVVPGILKLVPEFGVGHLQTLIQNRVNCVRFKPGRGFIIDHSLTGAPVGSDYSRVNDLRAVYYGSKAAREAAQPYIGEENDSAGEGLRKLESAMSRPLEQMRNAGQIDEFELAAQSTPNDRLLGDVYVTLGIQPRRAIEMIYTTVYLK